MDTSKMKKEKLTLADAMKYPNAGIKDNFAGVPVIYDNIQTFLFEQLFANQFQVTADSNIDYCQLVLRSIDELTDMEKKYIADNFLSISQYWFDSEWDLESLLNACFSDKIKDLIDYLRSINIDIDGYIENGKAVKNEN